ncbi:MAG: PH domain-containing protein [Candidatus Altiarchaeota archaeon]
MEVEDKLKNLRLLEGEKLLKILNPHPLSFYKMFMVWVYVIVLSSLFYVYADEVAAYFEPPVNKVSELMSPLQDTEAPELLEGFSALESLTKTRNDVFGLFGILKTDYVPLVAWIICLFTPSLVVSFLRIAFKWILLMTGVGVLSAAITIAMDANPKMAYLLGITFAVLAIAGVELYRRAHSFYITSFRIITELDFMGYKKNELRYDDIQNLVLDQSLFGRLFHFGTLIPVTASGLGMGSDLAAVTIGGGVGVGDRGAMGGAITGGRSVEVPRSRSSYLLFGIPHPHEAYRVITKLMHEADEAPYLRKMTSGIEELVSQNRNLMAKLHEEKYDDSSRKKPNVTDRNQASYKSADGEELTTTYIEEDDKTEEELIKENKRLLAELEKQKKKKK